MLGMQVIQHSSAPEDEDALLSPMWKHWSQEQKGCAGLEHSRAGGRAAADGCAGGGQAGLSPGRLSAALRCCTGLLHF